VSHPAGLPDLFIDRSLGRIQVPGLLRAAGLRLTTLAERYGVPVDETVTDVTWLREAGQRGEAVFMKDARVRYNPAERRAVKEYRVRAFCLHGGRCSSRGAVLSSPPPRTPPPPSACGASLCVLLALGRPQPHVIGDPAVLEPPGLNAHMHASFWEPISRQPLLRYGGRWPVAGRAALLHVDPVPGASHGRGYRHGRTVTSAPQARLGFSDGGLWHALGLLGEPCDVTP
jgi:hypothetical protein